MNIILKTTATGILFFLTIITGFWLSNSGKPLNKIIFNIHKLIALLTVIFMIILFYNIFKNFEINFTLLTLIVVVGLLIIVLFITGALLSFDKPVNKLILSIHGITPIIVVIIMIFIIKQK